MLLSVVLRQVLASGFRFGVPARGVARQKVLMSQFRFVVQASGVARQKVLMNRFRCCPSLPHQEVCSLQHHLDLILPGSPPINLLHWNTETALSGCRLQLKELSEVISDHD